MKTTLHSLAVLAGLSFGLASCQKNALEPQAPAASGTKEARIEAEGLDVGLPHTYTLTKHGDASLSYFPNGKLKRISYGLGRYSDYTDYAYGVGWIESTTYDNGKKYRVAHYVLDPYGRCVESSHSTYTYPAGSSGLADTKYFKYSYFSSGRLERKMPKYAIYERTEYSFGAQGDLNQVRYIDATGVEKEVRQFHYNLYGQGYTADRNHLNPALAELPDPYLQIFGKPSQHLLRQVLILPLSSGGTPSAYLYENTLNADGYLTEVKTTHPNNAVTSTAFGYQVGLIGMQP